MTSLYSGNSSASILKALIIIGKFFCGCNRHAVTIVFSRSPSIGGGNLPLIGFGMITPRFCTDSGKYERASSVWNTNASANPKAKLRNAC